jgi:hypothetical protein
MFLVYFLIVLKYLKLPSFLVQYLLRLFLTYVSSVKFELTRLKILNAAFFACNARGFSCIRIEPATNSRSLQITMYNISSWADTHSNLHNERYRT